MSSTVLTIKDIMALIPHRYPFLLVDRMQNIILGESATGIKNVTFNEPFFQGHFPQEPIMPGVLIIEAMAQTAGALVCHSNQIGGEGSSVYFMSIDEAKFRKPVVPGDVLEMKVQKIKGRGTVWKFSGKAYVNGVVHAEAIFTAMVVSKSSDQEGK